MSVSIDLLGTPSVSIDGKPAPSPRGRKAWALLAYLLLTPRAPSRERIATLLFDEATDPLGALRWNLAQLRRTLGDRVEVGGEPLAIKLPRGSVVDTEILAHGDPAAAIAVPGLAQELLEGIDLPDNAAFETWLLAERRRFTGLSASVLREAATARLASGDADAAIELASRLVATEDFDEEAHALLVRAYVASGDVERARQQSAKSARYLHDELGIEPSATLSRALDDATTPHEAGSRRAHAQSERAIEALIDAGRAACNAGANDAGIRTLQRASDDARAISSTHLQARAQLAQGVALVHLGRGRDGEGATVLHAALASAEEAGEAGMASEAARELGYVESLRGRYDRAETWLRRAMEAAPNESKRASALSVLGSTESDRGQTEAAVDALSEAAAIGRRAEKPRLEGWACAALGRAHSLRGELEAAATRLDRAIEICQDVGWISFVPFPQALRAEIHLLRGEVDAASDGYEAAFALGCQMGDPCWEGMGARGIGLVHIKRGHIDEGFEWLQDATARCVRTADAYLWIEAYCLDASCAQGLEYDRPEVRDWAVRLEALAARTDMREMLVRSHLHRAALGDETSAAAARLFARDIDNPTLLEGSPRTMVTTRTGTGSAPISQRGG